MKAGERIGVAHVLATLGRGGAERVLVSLANALVPKFRVHFIATRFPGELSSELSRDVTMHSLDRRGRHDVGAIGRFARTIRSEGIQIVHSHSHSAAHFAAIAARMTRSSWLQVVHDHHGPVETSKNLQRLDRLLLRNVDHYFAVSEALRRYAIDRLGVPAGRVELLPNGIALKGRPERGRRDGFTVAHVARVEPEKDHDLALKAADRLRGSLPQLRWLCVGRNTSDHAQRVRRRAREADLESVVQFLGEQPDVDRHIASANVGVLTSRYEGLPMALLEYMALGLPVVVTDVGDCGTLVERSGGGFVVAPGDDTAFALALGKIANDPAQATRMGHLNQRFISKNYGLSTMATRVESVYQKLVSPHASSSLATSLP